MSSKALADSAGGESADGFVHALTLTDAAMLVAGSMIGSGIFIVAADVSRIVGSGFWMLFAWIVAGVITVLGALAFGELAAMYPRAGGTYVFLRESMSPLMGFLYGWTLFVVIQTGTIAAVGVSFGKFLGVLVPSVSATRFAWFPHFDVTTSGGVIEVGLSPQRVAALASIWVLTWVNLLGVRDGKLVQTTLTFIKTAMLFGLAALALTVGRNHGALDANFGASFFDLPKAPGGGSVVLTIGTALVGTLFAADAWQAPTFVASEVQSPAKNLPRALMIGTGMVSLLYVIVNIGFLNVLPLRGDSGGLTTFARGIQYATQDRVGTAVMEQIIGGSGATIMAIAILISGFGCNNGLILSGSRVYYAMARDGLFFARAGTLSRTKVPAFALVAQSVWASLLCLTGTYSQLLDYVVFAALLFYALTTIGLFLLRRKKPDAPRPYRALGYPFLPGFYVACTSCIALLLLIADKTRAQALSGLFLVLLGVPVFLLWKRRSATS
jgi:APA family basic amino acid/polyamine antiporter